MPGPRLQYRHSTGSGMQPLETSALQAGLQTMPHRIPPLPEIPPGEVCPIAQPSRIELEVHYSQQLRCTSLLGRYLLLAASGTLEDEPWTCVVRPYLGVCGCTALGMKCVLKEISCCSCRCRRALEKRMPMARNAMATPMPRMWRSQLYRSPLRRRCAITTRLLEHSCL